MKMNADKSKMKNFELLGVLFSTYSYFHPKTFKKKKKIVESLQNGKLEKFINCFFFSQI